MQYAEQIRMSMSKLHKAHPEIPAHVLFSIYQICRETIRLAGMFDGKTRSHAFTVLIDVLSHAIARGVDAIVACHKGTIKMDGVDYEFKLGEDE